MLVNEHESPVHELTKLAIGSVFAATTETDCVIEAVAPELSFTVSFTENTSVPA